MNLDDGSEYALDIGFVYCLSNPSYRGLVKIGQTGRSPECRARDLARSTACPTPFKVEWSIRLIYPKLAEEEAHRSLKSFREAKNREFFRISPKKAWERVSRATRDHQEDEASQRSHGI